jgi:hypothetical protein
MVINPAPPMPVNALMIFSRRISCAKAHPRQPSMKAMVDVKKHGFRPKMSDIRPYSGWNVVLVIK